MPNPHQSSNKDQELLVFGENNEEKLEANALVPAYVVLSYSQALKTIMKSTVPYQGARLPFEFFPALFLSARKDSNEHSNYQH
ncbi:MAG: hypothetical protein ACX932_07145 [Gammaproteobacteria bacterium]